jgi:hypothetical protein
MNEPAIYYLKPHYLNYACVLTRLPVIDDAALRDLLESSWRFLKKKKRARVYSQTKKGFGPRPLSIDKSASPCASRPPV